MLRVHVHRVPVGMLGERERILRAVRSHAHVPSLSLVASAASG